VSRRKKDGPHFPLQQRVLVTVLSPAATSTLRGLNGGEPSPRRAHNLSAAYRMASWLTPPIKHRSLAFMRQRSPLVLWR